VKALSTLLALVFLFNVNVLKAEKITPEILVSLKKINEYCVSPQGDKMIYTVGQADVDNNTSKSQIFMIGLDGKNERQITVYGDKSYNGCWAPDGKSIAFISDREGKPQAFVIDLDGGEARQLTDMENGIANLMWSPDGKYLSFTSDVKLDRTIKENYPKLDKTTALVYDDLPIRHWDHYLDEKYSHLFVVPREGGEPKDLMPDEKFDTPLKPFGGREQIAWSPNGTEIAYTAKKVDDFEKSTNSDIFVVSVFGGTPKNISQGLPGFDMNPQYSPNGSYISFNSMERPGYEADRQRMMVYSRRTARLTELGADFPHSVEGHIWSPDSKNIYFHAGNNDGTIQIWQMNSQTGATTVLTEGNYNYGDRGIRITKDGKDLVFNRRNYNRPSEIFKFNIATKKLTQLTDVNGEVFKKLDDCKIEARWITSKDSAKVHCWVIYPPDFNPANKYPLMTYCQGGPQQAVSQFWSYGSNFKLMASNGYVVIAPNRRGCPGFGQEWVDAIAKDYNGKAMEDILAATDEMLKEPYIDANRTAAYGWSAGGYAVFWLAGNHEGRFKAFISGCGIFNMTSKYGSTEELWFPNWDNGGAYWEPGNQKYYEEASPHTYIRKWDTPILMVTGELDYRVPYTQSLEAFTGAQEMGVPSRIIIFPDENHWILKPQNQLLWHNEFKRFLDVYCR
jgi:dipeptidyl aminopeptidase/acylaminoacyl peptidase